ncbi:type II secretion system protein GspM [Acidovorax sp. RAC01]|uniref:type II secretion system protein GspM n=1 Tax=Acidovorax sp. RAC01 TaxID=1842533 RepID=UPI0009F24B8D
MTQATALTATLQARWKALAPREQSLVLAAGAIVALALLWWVALAPALATLRNAPARHAELDTQMQRMLALQAEAQQLQSAPRSNPKDSAGTLRTALTQRLGPAGQLNVVGDRVTVVLKGAPADGLAQWLAQARSNAHASPVEARLVRSAAAPAPATAAGAATLGAAPSGAPRWDGTLVLALPAGR